MRKLWRRCASLPSAHRRHPAPYRGDILRFPAEPADNQTKTNRNE